MIRFFLRSELLQDVFYYFLKHKITSFLFLLSWLSIPLFAIICYHKQFYVEHFSLPVPYIIFISWFYIVGYMLYYLYDYAKRCGFEIRISLVLWTVLVLILTIANWHFVNAFSYYSGLKRGVARQAASLMQELKRNIIEENIEVKEAIHRIFDKVEGEKIIYHSTTNNNSETEIYRHRIFYYRTPDKYTIDTAEYKNSFDKYDGSQSIRIGNDIYRLVFLYTAAPKTDIGIFRSVTFSILDFENNKQYLGRRLYERSWNFWLPFCILFLIFFFVMRRTLYYKKKVRVSLEDLENTNNILNERNIELKSAYDRLNKSNTDLENANNILNEKNAELKFAYNRLNETNAELENKNNQLNEKNVELEFAYNKLNESNTDLENANNKLKEANIKLELANGRLNEINAKLETSNNNLEIFKHTYNKIIRDFSNAINDSGNELQTVQSRWDEFASTSTSMTRHDLINKWRCFKNYDISSLNSDLIETIYNEFLKIAIKTIHEDLKGLEIILDLRPDSYKIVDVMPMLEYYDKKQKSAIPKFNSNVSFFKSINIRGYENYNIVIIYEKLQSIIFNILNNSQEAISKYDDYLDENGMDCENYNPFVRLDVSIVDFENSKCLKFEFTDNGGGFGNAIINDVYKKPVITTKNYTERQYGEATSYIGFFVNLMNGKIYANNVVSQNGDIGAKTEIFIPIYCEEE